MGFSESFNSFAPALAVCCVCKTGRNDNGNDNNNGGGSGLSGGSVLTGGSNLSGGSSLTGGSNLSGGTGLTGSSSLTGSSGLSSSQGNSSLKASNAKTGDQSPVTELLTLAAASLGIAVTVYGYNKRSARQKKGILNNPDSTGNK